METTAPKHQPATPLPWRIAPASEYLNDVSINVDAGQKGYVLQAGVRDDPEAVKNAAYLVHAANEYPRLSDENEKLRADRAKLVEALRGVLPHIRPGDSGAVQHSVREPIRALLRELGEAE